MGEQEPQRDKGAKREGEGERQRERDRGRQGERRRWAGGDEELDDSLEQLKGRTEVRREGKEGGEGRYANWQREEGRMKGIQTGRDPGGL